MEEDKKENSAAAIIHLDNYVLIELGMEQGSWEYSNFCEVRVTTLLEEIEKVSTKREIEKRAHTSKITIVAGTSKTLPMYGLGDGRFLIGLEAVRRFKNEG